MPEKEGDISNSFTKMSTEIREWKKKTKIWVETEALHMTQRMSLGSQFSFLAKLYKTPY